jgi:2,4-dienoyl-CoA reductase (NADPH2)
MKGVRMIGGARYDRIAPEGLWVRLGDADEPAMIPADTVVLCAGQDSERGLAEALARRGRPFHVIGGAERAAELDAKRAIDGGTRLAARL